MLEERPDAVLVLGDTNSCIAAVMARRLQIPVYHMEAGNRCFDLNVPEETNRRLVDHVADFNLVYTEHARRNLLAEGLHPRRIIKTGSPMREVLETPTRPDQRVHCPRATAGSRRAATSWSAPTARRTLTTRPAAGAARLPGRCPTRHMACRYSSRLTRALASGSRRCPSGAAPEGIMFSEPFGFHDYNRLQLSAACCLSDSGTIAEESTLLGFPAITLRDSIERPEALDTGGILMTGLNSDDVVMAVGVAMRATHARQAIGPGTPDDYRIANTSERVVNFILSTAHRHHAWAGIRIPNTVSAHVAPPTKGSSTCDAG